MLQACKSEYERRGCPLRAVGWSVDTMCRYMSAKIATSSDGDDIGAYDHELPERVGTKPPDLPDWVLEFEEKEQQEQQENDDKSDGSGGSGFYGDSDDHDLPEQGWHIVTENQKGRKIYFLTHKEKDFRKVELGAPEAGKKWTISLNKAESVEYPVTFEIDSKSVLMNLSPVDHQLIRS